VDDSLKADPCLSPDLFEIVPALMAYIDSSGVYRRMSHAYEEWCGVSRQRCLHRHYSDLLPELFGAPYLHQADPHLRQALDGALARFDADVPSASGIKHIRVTYTPDIDSSGLVRGVLALISDVTDFRRTGDALHLHEEALTAVPVGISIARYDPGSDFPLVYVNPAFEQITGYPKDEILGKNCRFLQGIGTEAASRRIVHDSLRSGQPAKVVIRNYRKTGESFLNELQISPVRNLTGEITHIVGIQSDVTERVLYAERLDQQARYDPLAGIPNRRMFLEQLRYTTRLVQRKKLPAFALVYLDIDNLKHVNERLGHFIGDRFIRQIAHRIETAVRGAGMAARIGGDEFVLLLTEPSTPADVERFISRLLRKIATPFRAAGRELVVTASAGYALFPADAADADDLLRKADLAMYSAKHECRNTWKRWRSSMDASGQQVLDIAAGLRRALRDRQFSLVYQPRIQAHSGRLHSVEALIRWNHPTRGVISPADFIPVAEETGLIVEIGAWVLHEAVRQMQKWRRDGLGLVPVSINVSAVQLRSPGLPSLVASALSRASFDPALLELELTESIFMDETFSHDLLDAFRHLGVRIAIDDFGTGYSGLGYLSRFSVDVLKIDRSFTRSIVTGSIAGNICRSILHLARDLSLTTVAEGVETSEQAQLLRQWGCDQLQGHFCGRPMPADEIRSLLASQDNAGNPLLSSAESLPSGIPEG
jgi:diguanylate cyclase (GGDEF)-like protein/PAS domain S-box-containing protein